MKKRIGLSWGKPQAFELDSINEQIILRNNLVPLHEVDGEIEYSFDEYKYTMNEFFDTKFEQIQADLDYISMMTEVDL